MYIFIFEVLKDDTHFPMYHVYTVNLYMGNTYTFMITASGLNSYHLLHKPFVKAHAATRNTTPAKKTTHTHARGKATIAFTSLLQGP